MKKNYTYGVVGSGSWATALIKILYNKRSARKIFKELSDVIS